MPTTNPDTWAYHADFADLVVSNNAESVLRLLATADIALCFTRALVARDYEHAADMLASTLRPSCSPDILRIQLEEMVSYHEGEDYWPTSIQVVTAADDRSDMNHDKRQAPDDFGWAYVAVSGNGYCEAVTVTIVMEGQQLVISKIEWGRP